MSPYVLYCLLAALSIFFAILILLIAYFITFLLNLKEELSQRKMLKLAPPQLEANMFYNIKCGEIFCLTSTLYNVTCLCGQKVHLDQFIMHFQKNHLPKDKSEPTNDEPRPMKEEDDPIGANIDGFESNISLSEVNKLEEDKQTNCGTISDDQIDDESEEEMDLAQLKVKLANSDEQKTEHISEVPENYDKEWQNDDFSDMSDEREDKNSNLDALSHPCNQCTRSYKTRHPLQAHTRVKHEKLHQKYNFSDKPDEKGKRKKDENVNLEALSHPCTQCTRTYKTRHCLLRHIRKNHTNKPRFDEKEVDLTGFELKLYQISEVPENNKRWQIDDYNDMSDKKEDEKSNLEVPSHPCTQCTRIYKTRHCLLRHIRKNHKNKPRSNENDKKSSGEFPTYPCTKCKRTYKSRHSLRAHIRVNHESKPRQIDKTDDERLNFEYQSHPCTQCTHTYKTRHCLLKHIRKNHKNKPWSDQKDVDLMPIKVKLSKSDEKPEQIQEVSENVDKEWQFDDFSDSDEKYDEGSKLRLPSHACTQCLRTYKTRHWLLKHIRENHKNKPRSNEEDEKSNMELPSHTCTQCQRTYKSRHSLRAHIRVNHEYKPRSDKKTDEKSDLEFSFHPCTQCTRKYKSRHTLLAHIRIYHKNNLDKKLESKCDDCGELFRSEQALRGHRMKHTGIFCDICGKQFTQVGNMLLHKIRHTGIKSHKCKECENSFYTSKELTAHMIRHTQILPLICEICGRQCRDRGVLKAHMRRHTGERPAKCPVCSKCFFSFHDLNLHSVTHSTARPFQCDICSATFQRKKSLRIHKKLHSKDGKKHECKVCGRTFAQSGSLNSHLRTHATLSTSGSVATIALLDTAGIFK